MNENQRQRVKRIRDWLKRDRSVLVDAAALAGVIAAFAPAGSTLQANAAAFFAGWAVGGTKIMRAGDQFLTRSQTSDKRLSSLLYGATFVGIKTLQFTALFYGFAHLRGNGGWSAALGASLLALCGSTFIWLSLWNLHRYIHAKPSSQADDGGIDLVSGVQAPIYLFLGILVAASLLRW